MRSTRYLKKDIKISCQSKRYPEKRKKVVLKMQGKESVEISQFPKTYPHKITG